MIIPAPPVGARVRHTTSYPDGTVVGVEGAVSFHHRDNGIVIGEGHGSHFCALSDRPGEYSVCLEVLKQPLPAEPGDGYYLDREGDAWRRFNAEDSPDRWAGPGGIRYNWAELNERYGPLTRLIADPADSAPALPWRDRGDEVEVNRADDEPVWIVVKPSWRSTQEAEQIAAVILRAAREARQA